MKYKHHFLDLFFTFIISFFLNVVLTWMSIPYDYGMSFDYFTHRPFWSGTLLLFLLFNVFYFLKKPLFFVFSTLIFILSLGIGFVSSIKMDKRSDPVIPQDFYLIKESWNMSSKYLNTGQITLFVIGVVAFILIIVLIWKRKWKTLVPNWYRIAISLICMGILLSLSNIKNNDIWNKFGVTNKILTPTQNLQVNGFVMGNFLLLNMMHQQMPEGYTKSGTEKLINNIENSPDNYVVSKSNIDVKKPNIIMIQLEAFFDPTTLPNVKFSEDPIPFFHSLQQRYTNGKLGVNVFGAGTADTEFEVLTSMSLQLFPYETHPFTSHVNQPVDSIAFQLKKYGYTTSLLHNNVGWFYNRENVYPRLGVDYLEFSDKMQHIEDVYDVPGVPKDYVLFDKITQRTASTKGRDFLMGITMELHGPYELWYGHKIKVTSDVLPQKHTDIIEEYAYKINQVDNAIQRLINYYEKSDEPTMIVMYGDHLPWLGDERVIYYETGYSDKSNSIEDRRKMYSTPFLVWDNYRNIKKEEVNLGSSFLVPYIFKQIGVHGNGLQTFLQQKMKDGISWLPPVEFQKQEGWTPESMKDYRYLQYYYLNEPPK